MLLLKGESNAYVERKLKKKRAVDAFLGCCKGFNKKINICSHQPNYLQPDL